MYEGGDTNEDEFEEESIMDHTRREIERIKESREAYKAAELSRNAERARRQVENRFNHRGKIQGSLENKYRVMLVVWQLGWVEIDLNYYTTCWAAGVMAEWAEQVGTLVELENLSQHNQLTDHQHHPVGVQF